MLHKLILSFRSNKLIYLCVFLIIISTTIFRLYDLKTPSTLSMDEFYYVPAARAIITGIEDPNLEHHPPLAKEIIGAGILIFGDNPLGWRIPTVIFGEIGLILTFVLGYLLFRDKLISLLSLIILSLSSLWFVMSRTAMLDIFVSVFILATLISILIYWKRPGLKNALILGVFFGLTIASKWTAILIGFLLPFLLLGYSQQKDFAVSFKNKVFRHFLKEMGLALIIALSIYLITYIPYGIKHGFLSIPKVQVHILTRHLVSIKKDGSYSPFASFAWPVLPANALSAGGFKNDTELSVITMVENPFLLWAFIPAVVYGFALALKRRNLNLLFTAVGMIVLYVPWLVLDRPKYFYYMLPIIPLLAIMVSYIIKMAWSEKKYGAMISSAYLFLLLLYFFFCYPLTTSLPAPFSILYKVFFFWKSFLITI